MDYYIIFSYMIFGFILCLSFVIVTQKRIFLSDLIACLCASVGWPLLVIYGIILLASDITIWERKS